METVQNQVGVKTDRHLRVQGKEHGDDLEKRTK